MHSDYYGLRENAFQMTPDARLFFASSVHRRALAHLAYGIAQGEGFIVVTGEVGAGKTTLIERLCGDLDTTGFVVARIATTLVSGDDILRLVADAFGAPSDGNKAAVLRGITQALRGTRRRHLLIVDEAQGLPLDAIEELRMLSNVTQPGQPPLQTILMGQPQLRRLLASEDLAQLRQRVLASFHLGCLTREETHGYVRHRLAAVGWVGRPAWDAAALDAVHRHSGGIPRRINRLCSRVMLAGALEGLEGFDAALVEGTALELEEDLGGGPPPQGEVLRVPPPHVAAQPVQGGDPAPRGAGRTVSAGATSRSIAPSALSRSISPSAPPQVISPGAPPQVISPGAPPQVISPGAPPQALSPGAPPRDGITPAAATTAHLPPVAGPSAGASAIAMPAPAPRPREYPPRPAPRDWISTFFGARRRGGGR